jgi:hypothetical protein
MRLCRVRPVHDRFQAGCALCTPSYRYEVSKLRKFLDGPKGTLGKIFFKFEFIVDSGGRVPV